jgi:hypothetical protein
MVLPRNSEVEDDLLAANLATGSDYNVDNDLGTSTSLTTRCQK